MRIRTLLFSLIFMALALVYTACDTGLDGNLNENQPPKTFLTVNEINLPEGERLVSQVNISWWGDDPDGYITGFEYRIGQPENPTVDWTFTTSNDSTFILPIEEGNLDADVLFSVRAVDNAEVVDPDPPSLTFPIRNSAPTIEFALNETAPDTTYRVFSFGWEAADPDGNANLNRIEVSLNDSTSWQALPVDVDFLTVRVDDTTDPATAEVFLGRALNNSDIEFDNVNINGTNEFYVRAIDNAGAASEFAVHEWYIRQQTSRILFLNDYAGNNSAEEVDLHLSLLAENGINQVDYMDISDGDATGGRRVPFSSAFPARALADPTINTMLAEWDHIYWLSSDLNRNIGYALEITLDFFEQGGTMFINIPTKDVADDNPIFQFLPFERMEDLPEGEASFFLATNSAITPDATLNNPPSLTIRRNRLSYYPVLPFGETQALFEADFKTRAPITGTLSDFEGSKIVSASDPDESLLFFGIDFDDFTEDSELSRLIEITCIETLGFQQ